MVRRFTASVAAAPLFRYGLTSGIALLEDMALFVTLLSLGMASVPASVMGYLFGIFAHWFVSTRFVFAGSVASSGRERLRQKGLFLGTALVGLALTTGIMGLASVLGILPVISKVVAIAVSFQATYILRKAAVFTS